uniref:Uncharacterized protein n=1 Tax=viral metagenome TaxID=1070528 RepID=A0A6C0JG93_9ZZZZ
MSCFLFADDQESTRKVNIDELYDKAQQRDLKQLAIFNKILNRVHKRITVTAKNKQTDKHVWFVVPEYIFGEPIYDQGDCIAHLVVKLEENGFHVRYVHPNTLFVSWNNWVPSYVRNEIKKKTGIVLDEKGNIIKKDEDGENPDDPNSKLFNDKQNNLQKTGKQYTPINQYKPTGNLVYNPEMFEKIEKKIN